MKEKETYSNSSDNQDHLDDNELAQYAEFLRKEASEVPERLVRHVASCSYCRAELMSITDLLDDLPDLVEEPAAEGYGKPLAPVRRIPPAAWTILRTAGAVAAVVLLAWGIKQFMPEKNMRQPVAINLPDSSSSSPQSLTKPAEPSSGTQTAKSTPGTVIQPDTVLYAAAFLPNPVFENLVEAKYRAGSDPGVKGPDPSTVFAPGDTLTISWKPDPEDEYALILMDNKANTVQELHPGNKSAVQWKIDLKPGLYYWKFVGKTEMWKVGKFRVKSSK